MGKAVLPKEVADAIEQMECSGMDSLRIAGAINERVLDQAVRIYRWIEKQADSQLAAATVMSALVNGYEISYTPEQRLRIYYEGLKKSEDSMELTGEGKGSQFRQGWMSVETTLNVLGIKIEGINT